MILINLSINYSGIKQYTDLKKYVYYFWIFLLNLVFLELNRIFIFVIAFFDDNNIIIKIISGTLEFKHSMLNKNNYQFIFYYQSRGKPSPLIIVYKSEELQWTSVEFLWKSVEIIYIKFHHMAHASRLSVMALLHND